MTLQLKNESTYLGKKGETDWWQWTVFLETDTKNELDDVQSVTYQLHPTFTPPIVKVPEKEGTYIRAKNILEKGSGDRGFPLTTTGWGTFVVSARVEFKSGKLTQILKHLLEFEPIEEGKIYLAGY